MPRIINASVTDVRFPTSLHRDGSDAMNPDGDYSATYVTLRTDDPELSGHGLTFTIGRGNDLCCAAARLQVDHLLGRDVDDMAADMGGLYRALTADSQLRWLGPEKGVIHLSLAAVLNAAWDLVARRGGKPLWRMVAELEPEALADLADLRYVTDVLSRSEAVDMLEALRATKQDRIDELVRDGYPCYSTSAGWLGYSDAKVEHLSREAIAAGFDHIKLKVGACLADDVRRCAIVRDVIGPHRTLMLDANQVWDVGEAIDWVKALAEFDPWWIEEPTSPDDILGHAAIGAAIAPIRVATGEHCHNRVMFKQLLQAHAIDICQVDTGRLASINEILTVLLLAAKFEIPVCPHAGGVGLCEMAQHVSAIDYIAISGKLDGRVTEYVDHLHEHFTDPATVEGARYILPGQPGYSTKMHASSLDVYRYPDGTYWSTVQGAEDLHNPLQA